jgi:hypothetical protein
MAPSSANKVVGRHAGTSGDKPADGRGDTWIAAKLARLFLRPLARDDAQRPLIVRKRVDQRVDESVEPVP